MPLTATSSASLKQRLTKDGFCVIPDFLDGQEVAALRAATRSYPGELQHRTASNYIVDWDGPERIQQIYNANALCPELDASVRSERTLAHLRPLFGYDIALYHAKFILKDPGSAEIPWHQDFSYWTEHSAYPCQINCMVYLDDADEENGCLLVVPGSHRRGLSPHVATPAHGAFYSGLSDVDLAAAVPVAGRAGTAIIFGPLLAHASGPNRSSRPRHSYTAVYTNPLTDAHRDVLGRFFPQDTIKALSGPGPFGFCPEHYQRRNLWHLAVAHVVLHDANWVEITDRTFNDGTFEWLSARKGARGSYLRFEQIPLVASNRDDVVVHAGLFADTMRTLTDPLALVFLDCERAANARTALRAMAAGLREGTVFVIDHFHDCPGWQWGAYREFQEFIIDSGFGFDYLGRAPQQVAIRLTAGAPARCPDIDWRPVSKGIVYA
jgi:ectoine hydroxylase-related dioxygenase (phytanoyl-CoA dioxygenase family)